MTVRVCPFTGRPVVPVVAAPGGRCAHVPGPVWQSQLPWRPHGQTVWAHRCDGDRVRFERVQVETFATVRGAGRSTLQPRVVAALFGWHHATTSQLAEWCGRTLSGFAERALTPLFEQGVIERVRVAANTEFVWRLRRGDELDEWVRRLPAAQLERVRGWRRFEWTAAGNDASVRHNLLVNQIALSAAAHVDGVSAAVGERFCNAGHIAGVAGSVREHADCVLVANGGQRVVIEVARSTNERFEAKVTFWVDLLGRSPRTDTTVVFVAAPSLTVDPTGTDTGRRFRGAVEDGSPLGRHRVVLAWRDSWFPDDTASTMFTDLTAARVTPDGWEPVRLIDDTQAGGASPETDRIVRMYQTPARFVGVQQLEEVSR